jgi:ectoine hydroxylase-related dioxygenase (phytanoyl-CoA dioxygenase family)
LSAAFETDGYAIEREAVDLRLVDDLIEVTRPSLNAASGRGGVRHILRDVSLVQTLAVMPPMLSFAEAAVGSGALAVRGILFDKSPDANWKVIWHQDLTIAVRDRADVPGFGPWTEKEGVPHVQPPVELLEQMVAVRLHLDDCTSENGPVRVIPGSHRGGRLSGAQIDAMKASMPEVECLVPRGGILAFHSLLLHASSAARLPIHRRVIHIEYVSQAWAQLPGGLRWNEAR